MLSKGEGIGMRISPVASATRLQAAVFSSGVVSDLSDLSRLSPCISDERNDRVVLMVRG